MKQVLFAYMHFFRYMYIVCNDQWAMNKREPNNIKIIRPSVYSFFLMLSHLRSTNFEVRAYIIHY